MTDPSTLSWFHGRVTRDTAETCLCQTDMNDGTYLLRESTNQIGSYVLSLCFQKKQEGTSQDVYVKNQVIHYQIMKQGNGLFGIADGPQFPGPVELVNHHKINLDGLLTKLTFECNRPAGVKADVYKDVSHDDVEEATRVALKDVGVESEDAVRRFKPEIQHVIGNILHKQQPWFHGAIPRDEADRRLESQGFKEGMYLVRERGSYKNSYVLGLCHKGRVYHYLFEPDKNGQLSIKAGRPFDNLMSVVNFYSQKSEGLLCTLDQSCDITAFEWRPKPDTKNIVLHSSIQGELKKTLMLYEKDLKKYRRASKFEKMTKKLPERPDRPPPPVSVKGAYPDEVWKYEAIYASKEVIATEGFDSPFKNTKKRDIKLDSSKLTIMGELGQGNFGSVMRGTYLQERKQIPVAIKTLKEDDIPGQKAEILKEADIMAHLDHPNIVRLIGVTQSPSFMIVMELAPCGPLHKYLKKHRNMNLLNILILMLQVDEGMHYLEGQHFVHRDLAARNVLVVSENFVKISDFGMSRAMGAGNEYYRAERAGKWPLKWYAPECIYYHKFTSKGDVWSYGITMWEACSYGAKPYPGMKGQQIVESLDQGYRLPKPEHCPDTVYKLMQSCWDYQPEKRPTFQEIGKTLSEFIESQRTRRK